MIRVFDFFSGCGGTSCGFQQAGLEIALGLDFDPDAAQTYRQNFPDAGFINSDIRLLGTEALAPWLRRRDGPILFCGCAPCQPFSKQNRQRQQDDPRKDLLPEFSRFIQAWLPEYVFVENVPGLQRLKEDAGPLPAFCSMLAALGYEYDLQVLPALWFGVPQTRERLVLLASLAGPIRLPQPTHGAGKLPYSTVRDWMDGLPPLAAGQTDPDDADHRAAHLSATNLERIAATPEGGGRGHWPRNLLLDCHKNHAGHTDVYGRLAWNKPAAGLTTRCISYSNGRFGHPAQDRAISVREAACLQTFPRSFRFHGTLNSRAKQIGNAVPPLMAQRVGEALAAHAGYGPDSGMDSKIVYATP